MSNGWLKKLDELEKAATHGPWNDREEQGVTQTRHVTWDVWHIPRTVEDVTFIALSRNHMRELLELVKEANKFIGPCRESRADAFKWLAKYCKAMGEE